MFEHFTADARRVVTSAVSEAVAANAPAVTTEHLLLVLTDEPGSTGLLLRRRGVDPARVRSEITGSRPRELDADGLLHLGIDIDDVRRSIEQTFGPGALDRAPEAMRRRGTPRFAADSKAALSAALREAVRLHQGELNSGHLLLGIISTDDFAGALLLQRLGVELVQLRSDVSESLRQPA